MQERAAAERTRARRGSRDRPKNENKRTIAALRDERSTSALTFPLIVRVKQHNRRETHSMLTTLEKSRCTTSSLSPGVIRTFLGTITLHTALVAFCSSSTS